jgi:hypothetical protein
MRGPVAQALRPVPGAVRWLKLDIDSFGLEETETGRSSCDEI